MDIINCRHGGLSFLERIPRITLEKAAESRNRDRVHHKMDVRETQKP